MTAAATAAPTAAPTQTRAAGPERASAAAAIVRREPTADPLGPQASGQCACGGGCPDCMADTGIQPKLLVGALDDPAERDADRVADAVVGGGLTPAPAASLGAPSAPTVQRCGAIPSDSCPCHGGGDHVDTIARSPTHGTVGHDHALAGGGPAPPLVGSVIGSGAGSALDAGLRATLEARFGGADFGAVRVHTDEHAATSAAAIGARAYTLGSDVVFGAGQYQPATSSGLHTLAHELTHVVQQQSGVHGVRGPPSTGRSGVIRRTIHGPSTPTNCHNWTIPLPPWIAGTLAHSQISATTGILPRMIPRAAKLFRALPNPPYATPDGFADLWRVTGGAARMAEIKSTATGSTVAAADALHYMLRHNQSIARSAAGTGGIDDATYLGHVGGPLPGALLDLSSFTGADRILGPFIADPGKMLHMEADSSGAVVYWCTGAGVTGSPLWFPILKKALDELKKKLDQGKRIIQDAAARAARALAAFGRALPGILRVLFIILLVIAFLALLIIALLCALGIPVTLGGSSICSAAAVGGAVAAAVAILLIVGISAPSLPTATVNVARSMNPTIAQGEPENGADYERDADVTVPPSGAAAAALAQSYNPQGEFFAALGPITGLIDSPVASARSIASNLSSPPADGASRLASAAGALDTAGDPITATFIRATMTSSGLDRPGALASNATETTGADTEVAIADTSPSEPTAGGTTVPDADSEAAAV